MKFAPTVTNQRAKRPLARPSKLPSPRNPRPKWSPSANLDMVVTDMVDTEDTDTNTVEVAFTKESKTQMVTVCQPGYGGYGHGGYGGYGHQYCNEVAQETQYNVPSVPVVEPA